MINGDLNVNLLFLFSAFTIGVTMYNFVTSRRKDIEKRATEFAKIEASLNAVTSGQQTLISDLAGIKTAVTEYGAKISELERRVTAIEKKID